MKDKKDTKAFSDTGRSVLDSELGKLNEKNGFVSDAKARNEENLRAIHVTLKQIASNTENEGAAEQVKVVAAELSEVIDSMYADKR